MRKYRNEKRRIKEKEQLEKREAADKVKTFEKEIRRTKKVRRVLVISSRTPLVVWLVAEGSPGWYWSYPHWWTCCYLGGVIGGAVSGGSWVWLVARLTTIIGGAIKGLGKLVMGAHEDRTGLLKVVVCKLAGKGLLLLVVLHLLLLLYLMQRCWSCCWCR